MTNEKKHPNEAEYQQIQKDWEYDNQFPPDEEMEITFKEAIEQSIGNCSWYEHGHWNHALNDCGDNPKDYIWTLELIAKHQGIELTTIDKIKFKCYFKHYVLKYVKNYENEYDLEKVISALAEAIHPILKDRIPKDKKFYRTL